VKRSIEEVRSQLCRLVTDYTPDRSGAPSSEVLPSSTELADLAIPSSTAVRPALPRSGVRSSLLRPPPTALGGLSK
jgi:hypothetical protein